MTFIIWEEVAWGIVSGMAGKVDETYVERGMLQGEKGGEQGRRGRRMEGVKDMDEVDEGVDEWPRMFTLGLEEESFLGTRPAAMTKSGNTSPIVTVSGTGATKYGIDWDYSVGTRLHSSVGPGGRDWEGLERG